MSMPTCPDCPDGMGMRYDEQFDWWRCDYHGFIASFRRGSWRTSKDDTLVEVADGR